MSDNIISIIDLNSNLDETYERLKPKKHSIYWNVLDCYSVQDYKPITNNALLIRMLEPIRGNQCYDLDIKNIKDRKSTRLNSKSRQYLVCRLLLEKKKNKHHSPLFQAIFPLLSILQP